MEEIKVLMKQGNNDNAQKNWNEYFLKKRSWNAQKKKQESDVSKQAWKISNCTGCFLISEVNTYYMYFFCDTAATTLIQWLNSFLVIQTLKVFMKVQYARYC